jgi:hypothetical protein
MRDKVIYWKAVYRTWGRIPCALNTDTISYDDFSESFKYLYKQHVVIAFTDAADDGGLIGIKFQK